MTAKSLQAIGEIGGPRYCKRDSFLSILAAIDFVREHFGAEMEKPEVVCHYSVQNNQCIGKRCPFSKVNHREIAKQLGDDRMRILYKFSWLWKTLGIALVAAAVCTACAALQGRKTDGRQGLQGQRRTSGACGVG